MAYSSVTITGISRTPGGRADRRPFTFLPNVGRITDAAGNVVMNGAEVVTPDDTGTWTVTLPATDDVRLTPSGFQYRVFGPADVDFTTYLPATPAAVDFADLVPVAPSPVSEDLLTDATFAALLDNPASSSRSRVDDLVEQAVQGHTPGIELGSVQRTTNFTTTNTSSSSSAGDIPSFSIAVVGQGRAIDLRFHASTVYHSVANTLCAVLFVTNGSATNVNNQIASVSSPATNTGPSLTVTHRTGVLTAGVTYTFTVRVWGVVAGTVTMVGAAFAPIEFAATSR